MCLKKKETEGNTKRNYVALCKVYNMLNYDIQQGVEKVNVQKSLNIESSKIYKKYRKENWHSKYLHSHTLQEVILNQLSDRKSYLAIKEKYEKGDKTNLEKFLKETVWEKRFVWN